MPFEAARTRECLAEVEPPGTAQHLLAAAAGAYARLGARPRELAARSRISALA